MIASLIIALHLMGIITLESATTSLYVAGALLIIAELGVISFGLIAFNGFIALYAAFALHHGRDMIFGVPVGWSVLFGIAFVEFFIIATVISVHLWLRRQKTIVGIDAMIGDKASVIEWNGNSGSVNYEGEIWKANSAKELDLNPDEKVIIEAVKKLNLTINI